MSATAIYDKIRMANKATKEIKMCDMMKKPTVKKAAAKPAAKKPAPAAKKPTAKKGW